MRNLNLEALGIDPKDIEAARKAALKDIKEDKESSKEKKDAKKGRKSY